MTSIQGSMVSNNENDVNKNASSFLASNTSNNNYKVVQKIKCYDSENYSVTSKLTSVQNQCVRMQVVDDFDQESNYVAHGVKDIDEDSVVVVRCAKDGSEAFEDEPSSIDQSQGTESIMRVHIIEASEVSDGNTMSNMDAFDGDGYEFQSFNQ